MCTADCILFCCLHLIGYCVLSAPSSRERERERGGGGGGRETEMREMMGVEIREGICCKMKYYIHVCFMHVCYANNGSATQWAPNWTIPVTKSEPACLI